MRACNMLERVLTPLHQSEREGERERETERVREREREKEGVRERERERYVEYVIFIFDRNDGCLGTF